MGTPEDVAAEEYFTPPNKVLFMVGNHHIESCGQPETLDGDDGNYHSYFENEDGEQWVFVYNRKEDMVYIRGGDVGWEKVFGLQHLRSYIFSEDERLWLDACIHAIHAGNLEDYIKIKI